MQLHVRIASSQRLQSKYYTFIVLQLSWCPKHVILWVSCWHNLATWLPPRFYPPDKSGRGLGSYGWPWCHGNQVMTDHHVMGTRLWLNLVSWEPGCGWPFWCHGNQAMTDLGVMGTRLWLIIMSWEPGYGWAWCHGNQAVADLFGVMGTRLWLTLVSWEPGYDWPWCHGNQAMVDLGVMGTRLWLTLMSCEPGYGWPSCHGNQAMADLGVMWTCTWYCTKLSALFSPHFPSHSMCHFEPLLHVNTQWGRCSEYSAHEHTVRMM